MVSGGTHEIGVVVADDHVVFRQVAHHVIDPTPDFALLGEASSGEHALLLVAELHPELVLLDVRMPGMDGIEAASGSRRVPGHRCRADQPRRACNPVLPGIVLRRRGDRAQAGLQRRDAAPPLGRARPAASPHRGDARAVTGETI